jgi:hypothetical protein
MKFLFAAFAAGLLVLPTGLAGQEHRRSWVFLDNRLDVAVLTAAPGTLHVVRGERGRIEVASRSTGDGFAAFGLGGGHTRQLSLTGAGTDMLHYLVVVPERVAVRVRLPDGQTVSMTPRQQHASHSWGESDSATAAARLEPTAAAPLHPTAAAAAPLQPTTAGGLFVAHRQTWAPRVVDVPDLASVRSIAVRFEGGEFRVAASRPLVVEAGSRSHMELNVAGEPIDLVLYVPRGRATFTLRSGDVRIAESVGDRPRAICSNVVIHRPTADQSWFTFYPQAGRLDCP